jgi:hypothetical protein
VVFTKPHLDVAELVGAQVSAFFERLHEAGAFGSRPMAESFFVITDGRGRPEVAGPTGLALLIGFAGVRRREFHSFRIMHSTSGSKVCPVSLNRLNAAQYSPEELEWVEKLASQLRPGEPV